LSPEQDSEKDSAENPWPATLKPVVFIGFSKGSTHRPLNYVKGFWLSTQIWLIYGKLPVFWRVAVHTICLPGDSYGETVFLLKLLAGFS